MSTFTAAAFFNVAPLAPAGTGLATASFAIDPRVESTILVLINDALVPCAEKVKVGLTLRDPEM